MPADSSSALRVAMIGLRGIPASYGGVEKVVEDLSEELNDRGVDVTVYARRGYVPRGTTRVGRTRVVVLPFLPSKHLEAISHTALALLHALRRKRRYDVIHLHATGPSLLAFMPRLLGVPTVVTVHGLDWRREKWGPVASAVLRVAAWMAGRVPNATIVVSRDLGAWYQGRKGVDVEYIPNGVNGPETLELQGAPPPEGLVGLVDVTKPFVLFLGRLVPEKQVLTLVEAFKLTELDAQLLVAGPSSHSDDYVREVEDASADDPRITLLGPRYDREKEWLLQNAAAFVQPSSVEGLPLALLEAISRGALPVVSAIGPNLEPVTERDGHVAVPVVKVGDREDLAAALIEALDRDWREHPEAGQSRLRESVQRRYSWPAVAAETEVVYRRASGR